MERYLSLSDTYYYPDKSLNPKPRVKSKKNQHLARKPSETISQYADRLDDTLRTAVNSAAKRETRVWKKRKERKLQQKAKLKKQKTIGTNSSSAPEIPFGFQVDAPPVLVRPRAVLKRVIQRDEKQDEDESKRPVAASPKASIPHVGRKVKLRKLGARDRKVLLEERESIIETYRRIKKEKLEAKAKN